MGKPLSIDTTARAEEAQIEILRRFSPGRRIVLAAEGSVAAREMALAGLRSRWPGASQHELDRRLKGLLIGEEMADRIWGPVVPS